MKNPRIHQSLLRTKMKDCLEDLVVVQMVDHQLRIVPIKKIKKKPFQKYNHITYAKCKKKSAENEKSVEFHVVCMYLALSN